MDYEQILENFYEISNIPLFLYDNDELICEFSKKTFVSNISNLILQNAIENFNIPCYTNSPEQLFCGYIPIRDSKMYIIVGPIVQSEISNFQVRNTLSRFKLPLSKAEILMSWIKTIPLCDIKRFTGFLKFLNYTINDINEEIKIVPFLSNSHTLPYLDMNFTYVETISRDIETNILTHIEFGDIEGIHEDFNNFNNIPSDVPKMATNTIRSFKNIFIISTTLASRAAMSGGLDYSLAMSIGNNYLIKIEDLDNYTDVYLLLLQMFVDFTNRVHELQKINTNSLVVTKICREINSLLYSNITTKLIATNLNLNSSYICSHFKKETGKTITQYIQEQKIKEAQKLLTTTNSDILQISTTLAFSSQNYFHQVFRKITGVTPLEYRNKSLKTKM